MSNFHLGAERGDLTQAHWWDWERADAVVTGPPCPPVSRIGKRLRDKDPRQKVWDTCVDIIIDQGWKGALFFVMEMVPGILDRDRRGRSVVELLQSTLCARAPTNVFSWNFH